MSTSELLDIARRERRSVAVLRHVRSNLVAYLALAVALAMTPLPSYASHLVVRTSDIRDGAVTTRKIADTAVTRAKIRDGAVTAAKIRKKAVRASKLARTIEVKENTNSTLNNASNGATATCPDGTRVVGGGFAGGGSTTAWRVHRSSQEGNGWHAFGTNQTGINGQVLTVIAYCLVG